MSSCEPNLFAGAKGFAGFANGVGFAGAAVLNASASNCADSSVDTVAFATFVGSMRDGVGAGLRTCCAVRRLLALICMGGTFCPLPNLPLSRFEATLGGDFQRNIAKG
jgi:hypothetical protein